MKYQLQVAVVMEGVKWQAARASAWYLKGPRFDPQLWHPATVVSLGKKLCPSHPAVKVGNILYICQGTAEKQLHVRAQLKSSFSS